MSPEEPGNLVVLDIEARGGDFYCHCEKYIDGPSNLRVSWHAIVRPPGYEAVAGGAAYVAGTEGFRHEVIEAKLDAWGPHRVGWRQPVQGDGLMLIAVLPAGYAVAFHDANPPPVAAKPFETRMALYWLVPRSREPENHESVLVAWRMEPADPTELTALSAAINEESARRGSRQWVGVDFTARGTEPYPRDFEPDEALDEFYDLCAWIGEKSADDARRSFTGALLAFLVSSDGVALWFRDYVAERQIAVAEMAFSKGLTHDSLRRLGSEFSTGDLLAKTKEPWTTSAREVLDASRSLCRNVTGRDGPVGIRHVMGAYCFYHFPHHAAQLGKWNFDSSDWLRAYREFLLNSPNAPNMNANERAGWHKLFQESAVPPGPSPHPTAQRNVDIGIITIREDEFSALLEVFQEDKQLLKLRRHYNVRTADAGDGRTYRVAIVRVIEQGNGEAQDAARDLIEELKPALVLVVGIAGGLPSDDFTLGDVIVSSRINEYSVESRAVGKGAEYSLSGGPIARGLEAGVANLRAHDDVLRGWTQGLPERPIVIPDDAEIKGPEEWRAEVRQRLAHHFERGLGRPPLARAGIVASSDRLVKDPEVLVPWLQTARHLSAVEMESAGVYRAARDRTGMVAIRGISDIVGLKRDDRWTKYACASAAAFARAYLRTTPVEPKGSTSRDATSGPQAGAQEWTAGRVMEELLRAVQKDTDRTRRDNALEKLTEALFKTKRYIAQRQKGGPHDRAAAEEVASSWYNAAGLVKHLDMQFVEKCINKGDYWLYDYLTDGSNDDDAVRARGFHIDTISKKVLELLRTP